MSLDDTNGSRALSESSLLRYFKQIFKLKKLDSCRDVPAAIAAIEGEFEAPEGFDTALEVIYERTNVRGTIWTLTEKSTLGKIALEIGEGNYFLISDDTLSGADSLFLCTVSICACERDRANDLSYMVKTWSKNGCPNILIGGYKEKGTLNTVHIIAAQLKTIVK